MLEIAYRQIAELGPAAITESSPELPPEINLLSDTEIYYSVGLARAHLEVYAGAIDMYDRTILRLEAVATRSADSNPDVFSLSLLADTYRDRGVAFTALGDFESAYQSYQQATTQYKKLRQYWQRQVDTYQKEQIINGESEMQKLANQLNHAYRQAEATYEKAIGIKPDDPQAVFQLGLLYESRKEFDKAQNIYDALSRERDYIVSAYRLGLIYFMQMEDYVLSVDAIQPYF